MSQSPGNITATRDLEQGRWCFPLASWPWGASVCHGTQCSTANCHGTGVHSSRHGGGWICYVKSECSLDQSRKVVSQSRSSFLLFYLLVDPPTSLLTVVMPAGSWKRSEVAALSGRTRAWSDCHGVLAMPLSMAHSKLLQGSWGRKESECHGTASLGGEERSAPGLSRTRSLCSEIVLLAHHWLMFVRVSCCTNFVMDLMY